MTPRKPAVSARSQGKILHICGQGLKKKNVAVKFVIDCTHHIDDIILDVVNFESYLEARININKNLVILLLMERELNILLLRQLKLF
ncbi:unnamed protein product [Phaedon cochleariae]|uniref:Uncharacterized protein n=1 Tax=Phaedon cochleariae TaxID=80249 RepID=A0A9N9SDR3_PHACE|nr:unnamed protein product [Phaedon cochleariae]